MLRIHNYSTFDFKLGIKQKAKQSIKQTDKKPTHVLKYTILCVASAISIRTASI